MTLLGYNCFIRTSYNDDVKTMHCISCFVPLLQRTIDYLKFDIEFSEWPAITAMLREGCLRQVKQLSFEAHSWGHKNRQKDSGTTKENYTSYLNTLQGLEDFGFQKWYARNRDYSVTNSVTNCYN